MAGNFDFLLQNSYYDDFASACVEAERSMLISTVSAVAASRRAMELIIKWIYKVDKSIRLPLYGDSLMDMMTNPDFVDNLDNPELLDFLHLIRKLGNKAIHGGGAISKAKAMTILRALFDFVDFIECAYGEAGYEKRYFDEDKVPKSDDLKDFMTQKEARGLEDKYQVKNDKSLGEEREETSDKIQDEIEKNKEEAKADPTRTYRVDPYTEAQTRKEFIDLDLELAGWLMGTNLLAEVPVKGMPTESGDGFADYVLYGKDGLPLAVVEAKKTQKDPRIGSHQAKLYTACLEKQFGRRPFYFFTNGFTTYFVDDDGQRKVSGFYSQEDLQRLMDRRNIGDSLNSYSIDPNIAGRTYQKEAIRASIDSFRDKRRAVLLVMATGTGKTRTAISIVDILTKASWAKNILFLADRTALVNQAKKSFAKLLPNLSVTNLTEAKKNKAEFIKDSRMVFSTYQTMINSIDDMVDENGDRVFTVGYFDLIIIDEAHRSIYQKYKSIFDYFDARIVGLTATPRDDIDKNTYDVFNLENQVPTYAFSLEEAIASHYLVDYYAIEAKLKLPTNGFKYNELDDESKKNLDEIFGEAAPYMNVAGSAFNNWLYNQDTVDLVINHFMKEGIKTGTGDDIGKTIVFAKNQTHANLIKERFDILYPQKGPDYARVITYDINYAQDLIDRFSVKDELPQIAISVNMLDTGIDVPEVVNLVFFKDLYSKIMFSQMIGRGTRLCPDLFGPGRDKEHFLIFDYGGNFERFGGDKKRSEPKIQKSLTASIFNARVEIIMYLQDENYRDEAYQAYRDELVENSLKKIRALNNKAYDVIMNREYVIRYRNEEAWESLEPIDCKNINDHISDLITKDKNHELSQRFDLNMLKIELDLLVGSIHPERFRTLVATAEGLSLKSNVKKVREKIDYINQILDPKFKDNLDILIIEDLRKNLRDLIPLLERVAQEKYYTNITDELEVREPRTHDINIVDLRPYDKKLEDYIKEKAHDDEVLKKIYSNQELDAKDFKKLEKILWQDLGTKEDYKKIYGENSIYKILRGLVGLDKKKIAENFEEIFNKYELNNDQARFVRTIMAYFEKNGYLDLREMEKDPFKAFGSITKLFGGNKGQAMEIVDIIKSLNRYEGKA